MRIRPLMIAAVAAAGLSLSGYVALAAPAQPADGQSQLPVTQGHVTLVAGHGGGHGGMRGGGFRGGRAMGFRGGVRGGGGYYRGGRGYGYGYGAPCIFPFVSPYCYY